MYSTVPHQRAAWPPVATVLYLPTQLTTATGTDRLPICHMGICIYHFVTPTHIWSTMSLLPVIFIGASYVENLWLTAQVKGQYATCEGDQPHWQVRYQAHLILFKCSSPDLLLWLGARLWNLVLGLPDLAELSKFLQPEWNFLNHLVTVFMINCAFTFCWLVEFYGISTFIGYLMPNPSIYQVILLQARGDLGVMAMKGCSAFPKAPALV